MATSTYPNKHRDDFDEAVEKGKDMASNIADKGREAASTAMRSAGDATAAVGKKAEQATTAVGSGMQSIGQAVEQHGPQKGLPGRVTGTVADALENTGRYIEEHGISGIADDLTSLVRRNPIPALLLGIGIGFLIAKATRSSS